MDEFSTKFKIINTVFSQFVVSLINGEPIFYEILMQREKNDHYLHKIHTVS